MTTSKPDALYPVPTGDPNGGTSVADHADEHPAVVVARQASAMKRRRHHTNAVAQATVWDLLAPEEQSLLRCRYGLNGVTKPEQVRPLEEACADALGHAADAILGDADVERAMAALPDDRHRRFALAFAVSANRPESLRFAGFRLPADIRSAAKMAVELAARPDVARAARAVSRAMERRFAISTETLVRDIVDSLDIATGRRGCRRTVVIRGPEGAEVRTIEEFYEPDGKAAAKLFEVLARISGAEEASRAAAQGQAVVDWQVPRSPQEPRREIPGFEDSDEEDPRAPRGRLS